jgi:porin
LLPAFPILVAPATMHAQTAPGSGEQNPEAGPEAVGAAISQPGAQSSGNLFERIWDQDTLTGDWGGLRKQLVNAGVTLGLNEQGEIWGNMVGGLKQGFAFDGLATGSVKLDLEKLAGWTGATFFSSAFQIHGLGPSAVLVGNNQLVSNIEATPDTKLYALWLEQRLLGGRLTIRLGQEGANDQMMITQYGALFLNSSFGFPGLPAANLPSGGPNYPLATPFVRAQYQPTDTITLVGAVFNSDPAPPGLGDPQQRDKGGTAFELPGHALSFAELWYSANQGGNAQGPPGTYKLGFWYDSSTYANQVFDTAGVPLASPASNGIPRPHAGTWALYGIVDQMIWQKPGAKGQGVGVFLQVMGGPGAYNLSNLFVEGGLNWIGPFQGRDNDTFGLAFSYLGISPAKRQYGKNVIFYTGTGFPYTSNETVFEATYVFQANQWLAVQPDLQIVINPNAAIPSSFSPVPLKDAVIAGVRAAITF